MWKRTVYKISTPGNSAKFRYIKPFVPNAPFLYPLKTSGFQGEEKGWIGNEWVNQCMNCLRQHTTKYPCFPAFTSYIEICWSSISHYCVFWALFNPTTHNVLKYTLKVLQHLLKYIQYINVCDHFVDNKCFWVNCRCFCFSSDKYLVQMRPNGTLLHDLSHDYLIT